MPVGTLFTELGTMFDNRPNRLTLKKKFEERCWKVNETFCDYFHEEFILAKAVPVAEDELVDYIIDGIQDTNMRNQARI